MLTLWLKIWTLTVRVGVYKFKTGLMYVIKQKLAKREGGTIDRSQHIVRLLEFYRLYRERHNVDKLREEELTLRESGVFSGNLGELERKTIKRKKVQGTLKVLGTVLEQLSKELPHEEAERLIPRELKNMMESDAAMIEDLTYNIIPFDVTTTTNFIVSFLEVRAATSALKYFDGLPNLPRTFSIPTTRSADIFDFLHFTFGFQKDNVSNQCEHIVHLLAIEQSRFQIPEEPEPFLDEAAVQKVFLKSLDNYIKWCNYLGILPVWSNLDVINKEKKVLFISLYFLIWGEAGNARFLPECLCYIFHHETRNNDNGRAPYSAWRNYDDFNEYFWHNIKKPCYSSTWGSTNPVYPTSGRVRCMLALPVPVPIQSSLSLKESRLKMNRIKVC
ncbi:unnamed protein product [Cuscuta campestris]|uniref:1,3-beta-glucan synthase component FKS1-like domain-containing protein n=1 Tax=Cuscuta campestris TaxID=132261 RepID=A0A484NDN8_9ASTE|nr:unnamed protein product [Cuscuta campestris]